jgi:predicted nucleotidyltransferase
VSVEPRIKVVEQWLATCGLPPRYFACIYGSQAYGRATAESDLDVMVFVPEAARPGLLQELVRSFVQLSEREHYALDAEVPFENKLLVTYVDLDAAISLRGFRWAAEGIRIPAIEKTRHFLSSDEMRWRLALNVLTTPHIVLGPDETRYRKYQSGARNAVRTLARGLNSESGNPVQSLLGTGELSGESFLGYKDIPEIRRYLGWLLSDESSVGNGFF